MKIIILHKHENTEKQCNNLIENYSNGLKSPETYVKFSEAPLNENLWVSILLALKGSRTYLEKSRSISTHFGP